MHPEVEYISFLMLLFAGNTFILNTPSHLKFNFCFIVNLTKNLIIVQMLVLNITFILIKMNIEVIVTKLKFKSKSAGNFIFYNKLNLLNKFNKTDSSSETLRNKSIADKYLKNISVHIPKHLKPENEKEFGYYLAGLIDGDGHFSKALQLIIVFNELDASLAYFIKKNLGYGNIYKVKNKKAIILVVSNRIGLVRILNLISGKIRSENKINQINNNILSNSYFNFINKFYLPDNDSLNNYWLSGFSDADASFQIKIISKNNERTEFHLSFQIDQKKQDLLILIQKFLGGNTYYSKSQDTYYYSSTSFASAKKVINYFDTFHLLSSKHVNYLKWRKAYLIIQDKKHLTELGQNKIRKLKSTMNRNNSEIID